VSQKEIHHGYVLFPGEGHDSGEKMSDDGIIDHLLVESIDEDTEVVFVLKIHDAKITFDSWPASFQKNDIFGIPIGNFLTKRQSFNKMDKAQ
jgi:hypothetical protein